MPKRKKFQEPEVGIEGGMIPVLSCMFLLIPALLLAMQAARWSTISLAVPRNAADPGAPPSADRDVFAAIHVRDDRLIAGFGTRARPTVEVFTWPGDEADVRELERWAARIARNDLSTVEISADAAVNLQTLVRAMDALRGQSCDLKGIAAGEGAGPSCYLWQPRVLSTPRSELIEVL